MTPRRPWTPTEIAALRRIYPHHNTAQVSELIGRHPVSVGQKANKLGIHKSAEFMASQRSGRIQPGQAPWNKGASYHPGGRCAETQFKPGQKPHTWQPIGAYRVVQDKSGKKNLERKTSEAAGPNHMRWTPVARLVWEAAHGPVPKGSIVIFKPGQRTLKLEEITLDRLSCVTRAEHAERNRTAGKSPELIRLYQLKGAITRQVNRINKQHQEANA